MKFWLLLATLLVLAIPARADPAPLELAAPILDEKGQPVKDPSANADCADAAACPLTMGSVLARTLMTKIAGDEKETDPLQAVARAQRGMQLAKDKTAVLTPEEIVVLKKRMAQVWPPLIQLEILKFIDPGAEIPKVKP
jgi:hypothetical protein